jgi:CubicO group peptidase (beta-lactamase class C family)
VKDPADGSLWEDDTIVNVFSSTKGIIALGVNMLIDRGFISIDEPVTKYWPEFEAEGKGLLTVGQLLSHQAGLMAVPPAPDPGAGESASGGFGIMLGEDGWMNTVNALAAATPKWSPTDSLFEYHGMTFGHLAGELVRRVSGKPLVEFLRENIFEPLGKSHA